MAQRLLLLFVFTNILLINARYESFYSDRFMSAIPFVKNSTVNVMDFGAVGNGVKDETTAFQNALNSLAGQGGIVIAPSGTYRFDGHLNVPPGVTLEGTYRSVPSHGGKKPTDGTVLQPYEGRNNENGTAFITLNENSVLRGVVIYYPEQIGTQAPVPYPWSVNMVNNNPAVIDVECLNCWNAVRAVGAGRHYIARVQGQPINTGIFIDETYDIGRVEDVHWNPWFSTNKEFMAWQILHGRAFVIARSDWEYVFNTFAFGYAIGYHFVQSSAGACNGNFLGIGADMMSNASVLVEAADPWGILITNGEFTAFVDPNFGVETANPAQVVVTGSLGAGTVRFVNSAFWGPSNNIARVDSGTVSFSNCIFSQWDHANKADYALVFNGGSAQVTNNDFQFNGNQVFISENVKRAIVTGNLFEGTTRITNNCARSQVALNVASA